MKIKTFLLFALSIIVLSSCKKDKVGDDIDKIDIRFTPALVPGNNTRLDFNSSGGRFDCANVSIGYNLDQTNKQIILRFGDSYLPENSGCITAYDHYGDPAKTFFSIDVEPGDYSLEIINKGALLRSALHIDDKKIMLVNGSGHYISFPQNEITYYHIPKDAIWGYAESTEADFNLFRDSLVAAGCNNYELEDGNYGHFRISGGQFQFYPSYNYETFLMKSPLDTATLHSIMNHFCNGSQIDYIILYDGKGNVISQY